MPRLRVTTVILVAVLAAPGATPAAEACWAPPVSGVVIDPFRPPACPWCAGNRGLEFRVDPPSKVRAVAAGTVSYSGVVAGTRYVVVRLGDGRRVTYGRLVASPLHRGDRVVAGGVIGSTGSRFFFGLRDGDQYLDPAPLLGHLVGRPRLVPIDGTPARPGPAPRLSCRRDGFGSRRRGAR